MADGRRTWTATRPRVAKAVALMVVMAITLFVVFTLSAAAKPKPHAVADKAAATAALLQLTELPAGDPANGFRGWSAVSTGGDSTLTMGDPDPAFPACAATLRADQRSAKFRVATGDYITNADSIGNAITVFSTVKQAKAYLATYAKPEAQQCFQHGVEAKTFADAPRTFTPFIVSPTHSPALADGVGYVASVGPRPQFSDSGTLVREDVRFRSGRAVIFLSTAKGGYPNQPGVAFPGTEALAGTIADRLQAGLKR